MKNLGYYNGRCAPLDELTVPFNDRGHFFGDGVYEVTLARNYNIYALDEHIDRLYKSAEMVDIRIRESKQEMSNILCELVKKLDSPDQLVYWQVTRGTQIREHIYPDGMEGNLWVSLKPAGLKDIFTPVSAATLPDVRAFTCHIKTINLLPAVMYAKQAQRDKIYETILYRNGGRVTECSHSNVHIITRDKVFRTAPADNLILSGIARAHLIRACNELNIDVSEKPFFLNDLMDADEIIISSSTAPCMICNKIDGKSVGGRSPEIIKELQEWVYKDFIDKTEKNNGILSS